MDFGRAEVLSFEVLGALVDWERGLIDALARETGLTHLEQLQRVVDARLEEEWDIVDGATEFRCYRDVLTESLERAAARCGAVLPGAAARRIAGGIADWPVFADVGPALPRLGRGRRLALVTNLDRNDALELVRRLGMKPARIVTAGDLQVYKPAPELLLALLHELELDEEQLLHVSALPEHDLYTSEDLGVPLIFLDRKGESTPEDLSVAWRTPDLASLADHLERAATRTPGRRRPGAAPRRPRS